MGSKKRGSGRKMREEGAWRQSIGRIPKLLVRAR